MAKIKVKSKAKASKGSAKVAGGKGDGRLLGKKSGLNVSGWWNKTFKDNAKAKKTDAELLVAYKAEFPNRTPQPVGRLRSMFNRGINSLGDSGDGVRSKLQSTAYDKKGNATGSDWAPIHKPDPKKSKIARARALAGWKKKDRKPRIDSVSGVAHVKAGKKKAAKIAAKKAKPSKLNKLMKKTGVVTPKAPAAGKTKKGKIKLKVKSKKAA